ncbi:flagellin, partial [Desertibacillus haloalkaliphilus]|nr:flagellin [Desertibacillus haloalkaliphilus]
LSSGLRISKAADDAAGLAISEKMRAQVRGLGQAQRNIQDAVSLIQVGEAGLNEITKNLQRVRELSVQAASGHLTNSDRLALNNEVNEIKETINDIAKNTEFNEKKILYSGQIEQQTITTEVWVEVGAGETVHATYINVPDPPNPESLWVVGEFGTISG